MVRFSKEYLLNAIMVHDNYHRDRCIPRWTDVSLAGQMYPSRDRCIPRGTDVSLAGQMYPSRDRCIPRGTDVSLAGLQLVQLFNIAALAVPQYSGGVLYTLAHHNGGGRTALYNLRGLLRIGYII